jgi:hypothetical protein
MTELMEHWPAGPFTVRLYSPHFCRRVCRRCQTRSAAVILEGHRRSRSNNVRRFTVGSYCEMCAVIVQETAVLRQRRQKRYGR